MKQKLIAIFLAFIMVGSVIPYLFSGSSQPEGNNPADQTNAPGFESVSGKHVDHKFNSIDDAMEMTPEGVMSAQYFDISKIRGTPIENLINLNRTAPQGMYNANITKTYSASYNDSQFQLHTFTPEIVAFQYTSNSYDGYQLLGRGKGMFNVIGNPTILGSEEKVKDVIDVLSTNSENTDKFDRIISYSNPDAEIQVVQDIPNDFADQYYLGINKLRNNNYQRNIVYLNPSNSTMDNISQLEANSTERGVEFNTTTEGDITKVMVEGNLMSVISEPQPHSSMNNTNQTQP
ncbi:surface glycoprotein [Methanohalobium sp.]|uniref:surface glycoprotein n=1 Tax=Methanohalobium sp. TaxID=2837493 RepID=UPI0025F3BAA4|nr:surface glycoprotein [Methanohalobium sp.]